MNLIIVEYIPDVNHDIAFTIMKLLCKKMAVLQDSHILLLLDHSYTMLRMRHNLFSA